MPEFDALSAADRACPLCGGVDTRPYGRVDARFGLLSCPACGFAFAVPRPTPEELAAFYNEQEDYNLTPEPTAPGRAARLAGEWKRRIESVHPAPRRILEIGCQRGDLLYGLKQHGFAVVGADVCDTAREFAARHYGLTVHPGAFPPTAEEGAFDAVILSHLIEHIVDPVAFLDAVKRYLAPGGVVCIETPGLDTMLFDLFGTAYNMIRPPEHISFFTRRSARALFSRCGLEPVKVETRTRLWSQPNPWMYGLLSLARATGALGWVRRRRNPGGGASLTASMRLERGGLLARALPVADYAARTATVAAWPLARASDAAGKGLMLFAIGRKNT
ncbi:MAG: methyltransferase domain-containing protein [Desulfovibrio sp.]